jgi:hypothetical protein
MIMNYESLVSGLHIASLMNVVSLDNIWDQMHASPLHLMNICLEIKMLRTGKYNHQESADIFYTI